MMGTRQRQQAITGYRRILWPTDFSPLAKAALPHALRLARNRGAELVVIHVLPTPTIYGFPEVVGAAWDELERENHALGKRKLHRVTEQLKRKAPKLRIHGALAQGVPFDQILGAAKRLRCDLIVLATHGRTGLKHVLLGSVAENVVRRAPCPVLTVRPRGFGVRA